MATIFCLQYAEMDVLARLVERDPATWSEAFKDEIVRRSPQYQAWRYHHGLPDVPKVLAHFRQRIP